MQSDSATQCSEANGANEVTNFKRQFAVASTTKKCKQRVDEIRGKWKVFCPIPFPCAFSFLILQYALRFPGGGGLGKKKKMVLPQIENGAASNQGHHFFFRPPPPSGKLCAVHVRDAGDIAMSMPMRCLLL